MTDNGDLHVARQQMCVPPQAIALIPLAVDVYRRLYYPNWPYTSMLCTMLNRYLLPPSFAK